jgi:hypothetical protein
MCAMRKLRFETLEPRQMLSGGSMSNFLSSNMIPAGQQSSVSPETDSGTSAGIPSLSDFLSSSASGQTASSRWDWLAQTSWYVPTENLLAYSADLQLADPAPIADQTLWYITQCQGGQFAGESVAKLSLSPVPTQTSFTGVVTPSGQIRMEFAGETTTTGIGQMRFVEGAWRVEMQMATGSDFIVTHWAYMSEVAPNVTPPEPTSPPLNPSLLSDEWRWLEGTRWALADTALFGSNAGAGVFEIQSFRNGYFWGSGTSTQPFNVLGSVTPEGNLLFLVSQDGAQPAARTGILTQTAPSSGTMLLRTYEGQPAVGSAWTIANPSNPNTPDFIPSVRILMGSRYS